MSSADATASKQSSENSGGGGDDEVAVSSVSAGGDNVKSSSEAAATTSGGKQDQNEAAAAMDPAAATADSSSTTAGGGGHTNVNNSTTASRHYPAAAFPQKPSQQQQPHYTQWPMPPHTYAAGRQQAQEDAAAASSGEQRAAAGSTASNNEGSGADAKADTSSNRNDNEELVSKKNNEAAKRPQAIYSSSNNNAAQPPPPHVPSAAAPWGPPHPHHQHAHPHHPSHPHHIHHAQYQVHYQQWYRQYAHHHHQQQQQRQQQHQQGPHGQQQHAHHSHHYHWHRQQQQHYTAQMHNSSNNTEAPPPQKQQSYHPTTIYPSRSNDSTSTTATGIKRNVRELSTVESRDDGNTSTTVRMKEEEDNDNSMESPSGTSCTMSLGDFSMASLGSSSPKGKRRKGGTSSRTPKNNKSYDNDDDTNSLELSDKEIMNNLSMNSSYSSDMAAMLYGASPSNSVLNRSSDTMNQSGDNDLDLGKTPKKNNTSSKKPRSWGGGGGGGAASMDEAVFRLDSMTPRFRHSHSDTEDGSSPALLDLIGGAETPTTGLLMTNIENAMMDDISLNRNLRGHAFTPLPHMMGGDHAALGSGGDASGLSITPQLSWSTNNGSPLEITPRCFGLLDSTKSTNKNPLGSPKSFWKENTTAAALSSSDEKKKGGGSGEKPSILSLLSPTMREMEISQDTSMDGSRSTTPLPLNYGKNEQQKGVKKEQGNGGAEFNQKTPVHKHHPGHHGPMMRDHQHHPPPNYHMQASPWTQLGGYMPSPVPGAFPSMSPGFGMYPPMDHNPNDRIRNLRGRGPPVHAIPPPHRLPPPSYHHFSPLTNVMKRSTRPMAYHPPHGNVPPQVDVSSSSKSNCVPMKPPIPSKFQGDMSKYKDVAVPDFNNLVNFPCHMNQKAAPAADGTRNCVMCGHSCPCSMGGKQKGKNNNLHPLADNNQNKGGPGMNNNFAIIPSQNKGLCTLCDVNVWIVVHSGLEIKWCKGCKNFRPWAAFGEKGLATKCVRCRERQREKYAMEKEKKERAKIKNRDSSGRVIATN